MKYRFYLLLGLSALSMSSFAQSETTDTVSNEGRRSSQNVLLNASSASQPRSISLGIPSSGTAILDDDVTSSFYLNYFPGFWSWKSGLATESMQLTTLDESALRVGILGLFPMTTSKLGADKLEAAVNYSINQYGQNQIEANVAAPLGKGWSMNLNTYQDFDRGSNHLTMSYLQERIQFYKVSFAKHFSDNRGVLSATYLHKSTMTLNDTYGPFIFVGDGSVKQYGNFNLGHDQYLPAANTFEYIDVETGEKKTRQFVDDGYTRAHVLTFSLKYQQRNGNVWDVNTRLKYIHTDTPNLLLSSISNVTASDGYTYADGTSYEGYVQSRYMNNYDAGSKNWMTTATYKGHTADGRHNWMLGADLLFDWTKGITMTGNFAYEAQKDPESLYYKGQQYYVHNTGSTYFDGSESRTAIFAKDQWMVNNRLTTSLGLRLEYMGIRGDAANNLDGKTNNTRTAGWNLKMAGVEKTPVKSDVLNGAVSWVTNYRLTNRLGLELDAIATQQHSELNQYGNAQLPTTEPKRNYLVRGGINYKNDWIDLQSLLTYIRQENNYATSLWNHVLTKAAAGYPAGYSESLYVPSLYSIDALGWQTDVIMNPFKGFSFHGLFNVRNPRYRNYKFEPTFSDGYTETYDFSGKKVTALSSVEIELEPSYTIDKWHFWISARYYSRQYINITNSLYFNPRWETFGGIDYSLNKQISFSVNITNFLNQKGASAGIQAASLATDASAFQNYLTSGTYIRPFTVEFSTKLRF